MKFNIAHQESYSRGQLLLRTFFGFFYIAIPHFFIMFFLYIWASVLHFLAFWIILFTGKYPVNFFNYQVKLLNYQARVTAALYNLTDEKPAFGLNGTSNSVKLEVTRLESYSRVTLLLKAFFGMFYILIPHGIALYFRFLVTGIIHFIAFWVILFTGKYPQGMFDFVVGTFRWSMRLNAYIYNMTEVYPPFSGKE